VVRLRLASRGGLATDSVVVDDADVMDAAHAVVRATGLSYVANVQFRRDASGAPRLLEVNPRIPGTIGLSVNAGLNLPLAAMCQALGEKLPLPEPQVGLRAIRHGDVLYTLHRFGAQPGAGHEHCGALPELIEGDEPTFVLWDLDGTLVRLQVGLDDIAVWKQSLQERFESFGWTGGWSPLLPSLEAALEQAAGQLSDQQAEELRQQCYLELDQWEAAALRGVSVVHEVVRLLTDLSRCELHMALVSNNGPMAVARGLSILDEHLSAIGAGTTGFSALLARGPGLRAKPCDDMFVESVRLLERQHGEASRIVCIGDAPGDLAAAAALHVSTGLPVDYLGIH
jgi:phosphoglycolate phosphatase-like HAD superfamily hydrolase